MSAKPRRMFGNKEMASCLQVMRALQSYLDGHTDEITSRRVANHLEACRRCGMEASIYREMKAALARQGKPLDSDALLRLRHFGFSLTDHPDDTNADEAPPSG